MREMKHESGFVPGMLINSTDVKILICYMLKSLGEPMNKEKLVEVIYVNDIADYFDIRSAVCQLVENGNVTEDAEGMLTLSDTGRYAADTLETTLPLSTREKAVKEGIKINTMYRREKENEVTFEKTENGIYVRCSISDGTDEMMAFKLFVMDEMQAQAVKTHFLEDPSKVYKRLVYSLVATDEEEKAENKEFSESEETKTSEKESE